MKKCKILYAFFWFKFKINITTYFLFLLSFIGISQTYEKLFQTPFDDVSEDAVELPDNSIIVSITSGNYYQEKYQAYLYKLSPEGLFSDSAEINIPPGYFLKGIDNIFKISDTSFISIGICRNINNDSLKILINHFNQNLIVFFNELSDFAFPDSYNSGNNIITNDNLIISVGTDFSGYNQFLYMYDIWGSLINYNYYIDTNFSPRFANTIKDIEILNKYHLYLSAFPQDFWIIDKQTLQIDTVLDYPETLYPWDTHNGITENTYLTIGRKNILNTTNKIPCIIEVDFYGSVVNFYDYGNSDTNTGNIDKSLDIYNDKIYLGAAYNFLVTGSYPFVPQQQWLWLNRINSDYTVSWQSFYKGEVNYMPYKVLATSDGGALIISTKYDWNDPVPLQRDVHILKIDSTGYYNPLTGTKEEFEQMNKQILVYPNPAKDKVNFVFGLYHDLEINIFNVMGELVFTEEYKHSATIDISNLPFGSYIYKITGDNGFFEEGKLVKQ